MHSSTSAESSSRAPNDVSIANAEGQRSELPPPTVLLEAPVQHQPTSAFAISGSTSSPAATAAGMSASAEAASVGQDATNASLPGLSAEHLGATVDACRGSDAVLNSVTQSGGGIGIAEPAISATATVILPRMVLPSHYASQPAPAGPSQPSALGFVQRPQSPTLPSTSSQPSPPESATVSHPPTNTAQQFYAYYRSQGGLVYQQPYQQPYQHSQQHYQQPQLQSAVQGGQHGYYPQPQQHFTLTGASGSGLITSPQASGVAPDQPSVTNNGNHVLSSPPSFGPRSQAPVPMASPNSSAAAINMHSAISNTWPQPLQQGSASMAGPVLVPTATNADVATHSPPALSTAPADMDHAATVAAAAMATMINNANSVQQRAMDTEPAAALPSMMFSSNASTPPSPMDSLAMAAAAVAAASASATAATSAASSNGNSPPTLGTASNSPAARPRATRLRPPQPYPYLITISLLNSPRRKLTLREIYASIQAQYPQLYGPNGPAGHVQKSSQSWKNTVRFNLSRSGLFVRLDEFDRVDVGRAGTGPGRRSAYWTIAPQWLERIQREGPACVIRLGDARKSRSVNASLLSAGQASVESIADPSAAAAAAAAAAEAGGGDDEGEEEGSAEDSGRSSGGQQQSQEQEGYPYPHQPYAMQQPQAAVSSMPPPSYHLNQHELPHPALALPPALAYQQQQQQQQYPPEMNPNPAPGSVWASPAMQPQPYHPHFMTSPSSSTSSVTSLAHASMPWPPATAPTAASGSGDWNRHPYQHHPPSANASPVMQTATLVAVKHEPGSPYAYAVYQSQPSGQVHQQQVHMAVPPPPPSSIAAQQTIMLPQQDQQAQGEQDQQLRPGDVRWLLN